MRVQAGKCAASASAASAAAPVSNWSRARRAARGEAGSPFDERAGLVFTARQGDGEKSSARLAALQRIIAAAAAPIANMQISWMENSAKRTLTTALVWRSAT